ncbi:NmrA family NAD(P)-binding protein [Leptospira sp. GIMC2001]|uniref:NmrA family NAD(P)-binding protein n=1 Tax=Leptospira sp. GIMC2001 TaxID=1513297 RepID=UPI00234BDB64|nr:NmrA family NAD(P)-binding protein [Leptospira sp. GIMC2001]WCL50194.1 NmrA family NAD(P)-binding protein [Leptospira sp. GIMC2001]
MKIFVYGGTGTVGGFLIDELLAKGHEVYAGTRNVSNQKAEKNLNWVHVDSNQKTLGLEVLEKVERMFLLSPPGETEQFAILNPWVEKAKSVGISKVVLMTAMGVDSAPPEAPFRKLEIALENSGLNYNIIRPNWFMQNFNSFWIHGILADRKVYFPGGKANVSFIDAHDIASVAASLITDDSKKNLSYNLTGSESIDHDKAASIMSQVTGLDIQYVDVNPDDFYKSLVSAGLSEDYSKFLLYIASALRDGYAAPISNSVKELTGKDPITFEKYARTYKESWIK